MLDFINWIFQDDYFSTLLFYTGLGLLILFVLPTVIGLWKVYEKMGIPSWYVLIPFYGEYKLGNKAINKNGGAIFLILNILLIVFYLWFEILAGYLGIFRDLYKGIKIGRAFGKDILFCVLLGVFPFIMYPILGFGKSKYVGPVDPIDF